MPAYEQALGVIRPGGVISRAGVISRVGVPPYEGAPIGFGTPCCRPARRVVTPWAMALPLRPSERLLWRLECPRWSLRRPQRGVPGKGAAGRMPLP